MIALYSVKYNHMNLYEINSEIADVIKLMEFAETLEEQDVIAEKFAGLTIDFNEKIQNICKVLRNFETDWEKLDSEIIRLTELKTKKIKTAEKLKNYVSTILKMNWVEKLELDLFKLSFRASDSVVITDELLLPQDYKITKVSYSPNKILIKERILQWQCIDWAELQHKRNLQIK